MTFRPNVLGNAGDPETSRRELQRLLRELEIDAEPDSAGTYWALYGAGSYDPVRVALALSPDGGVVAIEGELLALDGDPAEDLLLALNHLNVEVDAYRFYPGDGQDGPAVLVRHDLLPNLDDDEPFHPVELRQALTGMCGQKQMFADALGRIQGGASWRQIKDAIKAFR